MKKILLPVLIIVGSIAGCATFPKDDIKVDAATDAKANMVGYKAYGWLSTIGVINDQDGLWEPPQFDADSELKYQINAALRKRGLTETRNNPDLLVTFALGADMAALKLKVDPKTKISSLENVPQAGIVVALIDAQSGFVVWAGVATGEIRNLDTKTARERLDYVVQAMFDKLPESLNVAPN